MSADHLAAAPQTLNAAIQTLAGLPQIEDKRVDGVLLVIENTHGDYEMAALNPTEAASTALLGVASDELTKYQDCEVIEYGPASDCVGKQVMWVPMAGVPLVESIVGESEDLANVEIFNPKKVRWAGVTLTAIRVETDAGPVVFIQSMSESQIVARSTKLGVVLRRGTIDVPTGHFVLLNRGVTAIGVGGYLYFRNRGAFQRLFKLLAELQALAEETFLEVTASLKIDGFDQMVEAVKTQSQMVGKMASIRSKMQKYPQYKKALTMPKIVAFVQSHPECNVELVGSGKDAKLVFRSDPQHRFKILKLLDDDYLRSELTALEYEANSKGPPLDA